MARSSNAEESISIRIFVHPIVRDWLDELASYGVYGKNRAAVAENFVRERINQELRGEGFLRQPPTSPRTTADHDQ